MGLELPGKRMMLVDAKFVKLLRRANPFSGPEILEIV